MSKQVSEFIQQGKLKYEAFGPLRRITCKCDETVISSSSPFKSLPSCSSNTINVAFSNDETGQFVITGDGKKFLLIYTNEINTYRS